MHSLRRATRSTSADVEWIEIALDEGIRFFVPLASQTGFGDGPCQRASSIMTLLRDITEKGVDCGVDGLICVNNRAGGHLGTDSMEKMYKDLEDLGCPWFARRNW